MTCLRLFKKITKRLFKIAKKPKNIKRIVVAGLFIYCLVSVKNKIEQASGSTIGELANDIQNQIQEYDSNLSTSDTFDLKQIIDFNQSNIETPYITLGDNTPAFEAVLGSRDCFEEYAELDNLGRCGICLAKVGKTIMPTEDRGDISNIKPTGWVQAKYDFIEGGYLYNRCHIIGYQLTAENDNERNLITGTRYFNVDGMLPFENMVADYVKETNNTVLYKVIPLFKDSELVCRGVRMQGFSVEDSGASVCFDVFVYNIQPGVVIDYKTGASRVK